MNAISPTVPAAATPPRTEPAVPEATAVEQAPQKGARFASMHTLVMRADSLGDLGSGSCFIRNKEGLLQPYTTDKIPSDRLLELLESGRLYTLWDHRYLEFDDLSPEWPKARRQEAPSTLTA